MRGVSCDADAGFDVGGGVFVLPLGISARGVLVEEELDRRLVVCCGVMKVNKTPSNGEDLHRSCPSL